jgi:transposase-like protein
MPRVDLTLDDLREVIRLVKEHGGNISHAAKAIGMNRSSFDGRYRAALAAGPALFEKQSDPLVRARSEVKELRSKLAEIDKHNLSAEKIREKVYGLAAVSPEPPTWTISLKEGKGHAAIPFAFWSDWHYGERVSKAETGGVNEYNAAIGKARVRRLVENTIRLARGFAFREGSSKPEGIVVALGGDMISGDIHEELAETNELTPLQCVNDLLDMLIWAIDQLKAEFGKVFVPCVIGNHGRTTKKMRAKEAVYLSYEWNLYTMLERHYAKDRSVSVYVPGETDAFFRVAGQRFLLTHGNALGVKGGDGIIGALGPIARGAIKLRSSEYKIGREFDYLIMGHWHQEIWLPRVIVNNALKGYDEYARLFLRADPSRPSQCLWFVHPEHGITARISVYVDAPVITKEQRTWIEIQK